jgi:hypothetical protein
MMSWKNLTALTVILGTGLGANAYAGDIRVVRPVGPVPTPVASPALVPPWTSRHPGQAYHPAPVRDLERHIERVIRRHYGSCVCDVEVDVDRRRRHVEVELEVHHPIPHQEVLQLLYSLPELRGYHVCLEIERD